MDDATITVIQELLEAIDAAFERGVSPEAVIKALGPVSIDHDDGVAHTRAQAKRVKALIDPREIARAKGCHHE